MINKECFTKKWIEEKSKELNYPDKIRLSEIIGFDVDLITEGILLPFAERTANNDKILIYERAS